MYIYKRRTEIELYSSLVVAATRLVVLTCNPSKVRNRNVDYLWLPIEQGANTQSSTELCRKEQVPVTSDRRWRKKLSSQAWPCGELRNLTAKYTKHGPRNICTQYNSQPRKKCKLVFAFSYSKQQNVSRWMEMQTCDWLNTGGHIKVTTNVLNYCICALWYYFVFTSGIISLDFFWKNPKFVSTVFIF